MATAQTSKDQALKGKMCSKNMDTFGGGFNIPVYGNIPSSYKIVLTRSMDPKVLTSFERYHLTIIEKNTLANRRKTSCAICSLVANESQKRNLLQMS